jgi:hypothetical protein
MRKYQKYGKKQDFIKRVIEKANDLQTNKGGGSGDTGKPRNDKAGDIQQPIGVDVRK